MNKPYMCKLCGEAFPTVKQVEDHQEEKEIESGYVHKLGWTILDSNVRI